MANSTRFHSKPNLPRPRLRDRPFDDAKHAGGGDFYCFVGASHLQGLSVELAISAIEELRHMGDECAGVLKQRPMTGVWVDDELRIGQMRTQGERVQRRDHDVV